MSIFHTKESARITRSKVTIRRCLRCGKQFRSTGLRRCSNCHHNHDDDCTLEIRMRQIRDYRLGR